MCKLQMMHELVLDGAMKADPEGLFYLSPIHEKWQLIDRYSKVVKYESPVFARKYKEFENGLLIGTAACYQGIQNSDSSFAATINTCFSFVYYQIFKKKGQMRGELMLAKPNPETATKVWNFLESKYMKPVLAFSMPSAKVNTKIYVPKLLPLMNVTNIDDPLNLRDHPLITVDPKFRVEKIKPVPQTMVPIRIICREKLPYQRKSKSRASDNPPLGSSATMKFDRVLIHFHGGGFIAMSTRSHQTYLRKWAKQCHLVILTVEYRLAPEHPYPAGFDDAWQAYYWIMTQAESQLGIKLNNVILAGDSAGGNLAMAVTLRAIRTKVSVPDGILLGYPGTDRIWLIPGSAEP